MELFYKRVYTVAFRLTGEEEFAAEIATKAIAHTLHNINENNKAENIFKVTAIELINIFLNSPKSCSNDNLIGIQGALLKLKPVHRAVIVWKDVLGFKISDNTPLPNYSYKELLKVLGSGRQDIKRCLHG